MELENLTEVLDKYASLIVTGAKENLVKDVDKYGGNKGGGDLYNSVAYDLRVEANVFLLDFLMEDYGKFVDEGVKGKTSTYPESMMSKFQYGTGTGRKDGLTDGVRGWLNKKKFQWRNKDVKGRRNGTFMSYESMTYLIARSIYNKGLKANHFFTEPFEKYLKKLPKELGQSFALDIEKAIILGTKK